MKHLITLLILLALATTSSAQWTKTNGPEGGAGYRIFESGGKLFACTFDGLYVSTDNAASWKSAGLSGKVVYRAITDNSNIYASVDDTLFHTSTQGASWEITKIFGGVRIQDMFLGSNSITVSVFGIDSTIGGLYTSTNGGSSWSRNTTTNTFNYVRSLALSGPYLLAATKSKGIYRTSNQGATWEKLSNGLSTDPDIWTLKNINDTLYVGGDMCFFYSTNSGGSWKIPQNNGLDSVNSSFSFYTFEKSGRRMFATMEYGNFADTLSIYSDDNGKNWYPRNSATIPTNARSFNYSKIGNILYEQNDNGIFKTTNQGTTWTEHNNGIPALFSEVGFAGGDTLIAWGAAGLYRTDNGGVNWTHITDGNLSWIKVRGAINFKGNNYFYGDSYWSYSSSAIASLGQGAVDVVHFGNALVRLTNQNSLQYSTDGQLWDSNTFTQPDELLSKAYGLASSGSCLILQCFSQNYDSLQWYRSTDGNNWAKVYEGDFNILSFGSAVHKGVFYIGTQSNGLMRSDDDGLTWKNDEGIGQYASIDALYSSGSHLFCDVGYDNSIATDGINMRKENSGSFTFAGQGLPFTVSSLYLHNDGYLYAGSTGIWRRPLSELGISNNIATDPIYTLRPNPTTDYIIVDEDATVTLFASTGAEVFSTKATQDERIALPKLASGVYIAKIEMKSGVKSAKVVVQ